MVDQPQRILPVDSEASMDNEEEKDLKTQVEEFLQRTKYCRLPEKPPLSLSALVTMAIVTSDRDYVTSTKAIMDFISTKFVHYRGNGAAKSWKDDVRECLKESFELHSRCECDPPPDGRRAGEGCERCDGDLWTVSRQRAALTVRVAVTADRENAGQLKRSHSSDEDSNPGGSKRIKVNPPGNDNENDHVQGAYRGNKMLQKYCEELAELSIKFPKPPLNDTCLLITIAILGNPKEILTTSEIVKSVSKMFPYVRNIDIALLRKAILEKLDSREVFFEKLYEKNEECRWKLKFDNVTVFKLIKTIRSDVLKKLLAEHPNGILKKSPKKKDAKPSTSNDKSLKSHLAIRTIRNSRRNDQQLNAASNTAEQRRVEFSDEDLVLLVRKCIAKTLNGYVTQAEAERYISQRRGPRPDLAVKIDRILRSRPDVFLQVPAANGYWSLRPETTHSSVTYNSQMKECCIVLKRCPLVERKLVELKSEMAAKIQAETCKTHRKKSARRFNGWIVPEPNTFRGSVHRLVSMLDRHPDLNSDCSTITTKSDLEAAGFLGFDSTSGIFRGWDKVNKNSRDELLQKIKDLESNEDLENVFYQCLQALVSNWSNLPAEQEPLISFPVLIVSAILNGPDKNCTRTQDIYEFIEERLPYYRSAPGAKPEWHKTVLYILENDSRFSKIGLGYWGVDSAVASDIVERAISNFPFSSLPSFSSEDSLVVPPFDSDAIEHTSPQLIDLTKDSNLLLSFSGENSLVVSPFDSHAIDYTSPQLIDLTIDSSLESLVYVPSVVSE